MLSRRALLLSGSAAVATGVAAAAFENPTWAHRAGHLIRADPDSAHRVPSGPVGEIVSGSFFSKARNATTGWSVAYPHGTTPGTSLPLLLELHGRGGDHTGAFGSHRLQYFLSAAVRAGTPPFALRQNNCQMPVSSAATCSIHCNRPLAIGTPNAQAGTSRMDRLAISAAAWRLRIEPPPRPPTNTTSDLQRSAAPSG